jgi:hypothetical protein
MPGNSGELTACLIPKRDASAFFAEKRRLVEKNFALQCARCFMNLVFPPCKMDLTEVDTQADFFRSTTLDVLSVD